MSIRLAFTGAVLVLAAAAAWRVAGSDAVARWWHPPAAAPRPIVFDNGSVRDRPAAPGASAPAAAKVSAPGVARKCLRGSVVVAYTDQPCPAGSREAAITGEVSVLDSAAGARPGAARGDVGGATGERRRATVLESLDESGNQNLRDKRMERMIEGR